MFFLILMDIFLFSHSFGYSQIQTKYRTYGTTGFSEFTRDIMVDQLGNIFLSGWSRNLSASIFRAFIIKLNASCEMIDEAFYIGDWNMAGFELLDAGNGQLHFGMGRRFGTRDQFGLARLDANLGFIAETYLGGFDNQFDEELKDVVELDSELVLVGTARNNGGIFMRSNVHLARFNENTGAFINNVIVGGESEEAAFSAVRSSQNQLLAVGGTRSFPVNANRGEEVYLTVFDLVLNLLGTRTFGGNGRDRAYSIAELPGGDFLIAGFSESFDPGGDGLLIRLDSDLNIVFCRTYGVLANREEFQKIIVLSNGILAVGSTETLSNSNQDILVVKTDFNGNVLWARAFGGTGDEVALDVEEVGNAFLIAGQTDSPEHSSGLIDAVLICLDTSGVSPNNCGWTVSLPVEDRIMLVDSGGFETTAFNMPIDSSRVVPTIVLDSLHCGKALNAEPLILDLHAKNTQTAVLDWRSDADQYQRYHLERAINGSPYQEIYSISSNWGSFTDSERLQYTDQPVENASIAYRLKGIDFNGETTYSNTVWLFDSQQDDGGVRVFPNPSSDFVRIAGSNEVIEIRLYDMAGRLILNRDYSDWSSEIRIDVRHLNGGIYLLKVRQRGSTSAHRLQIQR